MSKHSAASCPGAFFASQRFSARSPVDRSRGALLRTLPRGIALSKGIATVVALVTILLSSGIALHAQTLLPNWYQQSPVNSPGSRYIHSMAFDAGHSQVVLFGGFKSSGYANDTWLWNGTNWTQANPTSFPSPRAAASMVYDPVHGNVVLFGGFTSGNGTPRLGDTWLWNGTNWTQATPTTSPSPRSNADMVYDAATGQIVLFGGTNGSDLGDTWLWDGTNWTQAQPAGSPSPRVAYGMAYDAATSRIVLFGGSSNGQYQSDTWLWSGTTWTQQLTANVPPARYSQGMDFDAATGRVVMFGGYNGSAYLNDTWNYDGTNWTQDLTNTNPAARTDQNAMVYDSSNGQMFMFGGYTGSAQLNDTWNFGLPGNLGNVNVCSSGTGPAPCSSTVTFYYFFANGATLAATPTVVTQGIVGLDFTLGTGSTCGGTVAAGGTCTVNVVFSPVAPGARTGSIQLTSSAGIPQVATPIFGVGQGPAAAVAPGAGSTLESGLNFPYGAAVDAGGDVFFTDFGAGTVAEAVPNSNPATLGPKFSKPTGIAVDGAGNLFVTDAGAPGIIEVPYGCTSTNCEVSLTASTGAGTPSGVAVDGGGDIFFTSYTSNSSIAQAAKIPVGCTSTSCVQVVWTGPTGQPNPSQPSGIAVDAAGDVFVSDGGGLHNVTKIPAGCTSAACQVTVGTQFEAPTGVAVDAAFDVFVSDANLGVFEVPVGCTTYSCQNYLYAGGAPFGVAINALGDIVVPVSASKAVVELFRSQTQALNFPTTTLGTTSTASATLQNVGNQPLQAESPGLLTVSGASYSNTPGPGTIPDCSTLSALASGAECNVTILFSPQSYNVPNTGTAIFHTNSLNSANASQTVSLFGMGARPVQNFYPVTVTEPGSGSGTVTDVSGAINCAESSGTSSGTCSASLPGSGVVTFTATASGNSTFQGWGGACASSGTNSMCSVVLTAATTITATFVNPATFPLTVTTSGTGSGTVTDNLGEIACSGGNGTTTGLCSGPYPSGSQVTLTALASGNSVFAGWGGACSNSGASATCVVTMTSALNVSASFVAPGAAQSGMLMPITAGVVYGQGGSLSSGVVNKGGVSANSLDNPQGMFVDTNGSLYLSDGANNRVLFYPAGSTTPTRIYGQGGSFTSKTANNGGISASSLSNPQGIAVDTSGNVYISDESNSRVLFYPVGSTTATRVYGQPGFTTGSTNNGGVSANSLLNPIGIALDSSGNLYVGDYGNSRVMFYAAGSTTATRVYGQGGSFTSNTPNNGGISATSLNQPGAVALDSSGDLYVADIYNNRVLFYPANSTTATQVYGQGGSFTSGTANNGGVNASTLNNPLSVSVDSNGGLYVADRSNNRVLFYPFGTTNAARVYGQGNSFNSSVVNNGGVSANSLSGPWSVVAGSSGLVYVADYSNNRVLQYGSFGNINVCAANQNGPTPCNSTVTYTYAPAATTTIGAIKVVTQGGNGLDFALGTGGTCAGIIVEGTSCTVNLYFAPLAPGLRAGALQMFDNVGDPVVSTLASGVGQAPQAVFGPGVQTVLPLTGLHYNVGLAVDAAGNTFVADYNAGKVVKLSPSGVQTTVPASGLSSPIGVAVDGVGNVYIVDLNLSYAVKVTPSGVQTTLGSGLSGPIAIALDGAGDAFISDQNNNRVVEITPSGVQTTVPFGGLSQPWGVAVDTQGDVFVADGEGQRVVKVTPDGIQTTVQIPGLNQPYDLALDAAGDLYVTDPTNARVVEVPANGGAQFTVGTGLNYPSGVTVDAAGNVLIGDQGSGQVFKVNRSQPPALSFALTNVGSTSTDSPQSFAVQNVGNQPLAGTLTLPPGGNFTQIANPDCSAALPLAPGAACSESFSFAPQSATFFSAPVVYNDNSLNGFATQTVTLSGTGAIPGVATTVAVPNVVGQAQLVVSAPITSAGLAMGTVSTASSQTVLPGVVISQSPAAGTQVAVGSAVNLLVSSGLPQPPVPDPLSIENNYFVTGDFVSAGVTLRGTGQNGMATGNIVIPSYSPTTGLGVPDGSDVVDAFLYWETLESTATASSTNGTFNNYPIVGQQIGNDLPNYVDGQFTGTIRVYRASVNAYLPVGAEGIRYVSGSYTVSLPDGRTALPLTEGASLVMVYRVLSPNFPLKSVVLYDGSATSTVAGTQVVQGFYDAVGGAGGTGKSSNLFASGGSWNSSTTSVTLGQSNQYSAPLNAGAAYAAVILSTPVNNSDNDGILDAWKAGPAAGDFHAGQPGYYDVKTATWVGLPGAKHGQKDLFVQLDYMCGAILTSGSCDPTQENLFPSPDASGNDPLVMVQQAFAKSGVQLHLQVGNAVPEDLCTDSATQICQFPGEPGVVGWKNSLEFSKLYPRNLVACLTGGDCTTRFPYGQKDSYHYVLMGHSLAIPAWNSRYGTLTSIVVSNGVTTIGTVDRGTGINACPSRITLSGVLGSPGLNGVYGSTSCADTKTITFATPGVPNFTYPNNTLAEPVIGLTSGTVTSISGYSDLGGADSAVTLGLWLTAPNQDMSKKANVLAGTIFHEIGHTLGLSHGGLYYDTAGSYVPTFDANCKPNYQSVMNYLFQLDGVGPNQAVAFSNQALANLNESSAGSVTQLTDAFGTAATFPTSAWYVPYTTGSPVSPATRHCDGTPLIGDSAYRVDASIAPITPPWTNGQDLNFIGSLQTNERGFNDLTNMDLRQVGATGGEFASLASVLSFGSSVSPLNITAGGNVTLGSGGTVALGSGGNVTLGSGGNVTLGSGGTITLGSGGNVTLGSGGNVTLGSGGTVTPGSGGNITLGSGGNVTLGSGGTITLGSGGNVTIPPGGSGGNVTLGSGGTITLGSGGIVTIPASGGSYPIDGNGGTITLGSGGNVTLGSGGNVTLGSGGTITLGSGGNVTLGSGGNVTLGSGGTITLGSGGNVTLGSGGNVTLGSGGTITLGSGGNVTLGSGGNVTLGSGGTVTLGSGGNVALGSGGNVTLGSGGSATLGAGGTVTLGSGGNVTLGSGGNVTLGSGGTITLGSGGNVTLGSGGNVTLGSGGTITLGSGGNITLGSGGTITLGSGGTVTPAGGGAPVVIGAGGTYTFGSSGGNITLGSGGNVTLGSGGNVTLGSGGTITLGSGGNITLGSGGNVTLGSGGNITLGSGGTITLGSGGNVTLGSGGVVTLGNGGSFTPGSGESSFGLASVSNITPISGGPQTGTQANNELTYETANSVVRPPSQPTETKTGTNVRITWTAPAFGVVQTYTIYRSSDGATPIVIGSVSGVNGFPPATQFTDTNPDLTATTVVYTISTLLVPDTSGPSRQSPPSPPAVLKNDQSISLGALPSSVVLPSSPTVTATALSGGVPNGLQVTFSATGSCSVGTPSIASGVSSTTLTLGGIGSCTVTASQPGTTAFNAANSVSGSFMVLPHGSGIQSQTITFPTLPNAQYGNTFSLSASSNAVPAIPVTFAASGPCAANGSISGVGVCKITASAAGNSSYSAASVTQSFTIYPAVLKVTATNQSVAYGQPLPALTYGYSGLVNNEMATAVVSGMPGLSTTATSTSAAGSYPITVSTGTLASANYSFLYVNGTLTVQQANQAALILTTTSPLIYGQSETMSVVGGTTGGLVTYNVTGPCSVSGNQLTATGGSGTCSVTATMAGNGNYNSVTSTPANIVALSPAGQAVAFSKTPPANAAFGSSFTVAATGGASGNAVTFTSSGSCSVNGSTYTMTSGSGSCSVIANQKGNSNYAAAVQVTITVAATKIAPSVTFTGAPVSAAYKGTFTVASTTNASTVASIVGSGACSTLVNVVTMTSGTGTCALTATWAADNNYSGTTASQSTAASKATPTVTFTGAPVSAAYKTTFTVASTTNASTVASIVGSGACSNAGTAVTMTSGTGTCALTATWAADSNYSGTTASQSTAATKATPTVTFTGAPVSAAYKGTFTVASTTNASTVASIVGSGACSNVGTAVTMTSGTGSCLLTATWAADGNYSGITASQSTLATPLGQAITFTTNPPASAAYGSSFTVAATGGGSGNAVTFTSSGACSNSGATYTITSSTGTCSVIASQAGNSNYAAATPVTKTVSAAGPLLSVSPSSINFGTVYQGSVSAQTITVTNIGSAAATITDPLLSIVKGGNSNEFVALSLCPKSLAAGKSCTVLIGFIAGPYYTQQTATLQIVSNAPGSPQPVALSALVINPVASFNPTSLSFGTIKHATSSSLNVTLTNSGGTTLSLSSIGVTGANATSFAQTNNCGSSLAAGASCTIAVKFTPAAAGTLGANLTVVDNAQSATQTVALSGKGS